MRTETLNPTDIRRRLKFPEGGAGLLAAGALALSSCAASAVDWPNWRGPDHNGISRETGWDPTRLKEDSGVLWRKQIGTGFASVAVSDGRVYAMGNTGPTGDEKEQQDILRCLDARTGQEIWRHSYPSPLQPTNHEGGPSATPTVDAGKVYIVSKHGEVRCVDGGHGTLIWKTRVAKEQGFEPPGWGFSGSPIIVDDLIVLNMGARGVALHKKTGQLAWANEKGSSGYASPVPYTWRGKSCAVILGHRELYAVRVDSGEVLWKQPWRTLHDENAPDPIVSGNRLFVSTGLGTGAALFEIGDDGLKQLWRQKDFQNWLNGSVLWQGHVYGVDNKDRALKCVDLQTGAVEWSHGGVGVGSLMLADGRLIALSDKGTLLIAEAVPSGYREIASAQILGGKCWTVPVLSGGHIYVRNAAGDLVCVNVSVKHQ